MALLIPLVVVLLAVVVQVGVVVRDRVALVRVTSSAARAAMVEPTDDAVARELRQLGASLRIESWRLSGSRSAGGLLTLEVSAAPTRVPVVGLAVSRLTLTERMVVRVEG